MTTAVQGHAIEEGRTYDPNTVLIAQPSTYQQFKSLPPEKRARCCYFGGCGCCIFGLVTFLLLFFLIPRVPRAAYVSTVTTFNPYTVTQTYKVYNRNMYSLTLSDWDMIVQTSTSLGTFTSGNGQLDDDDNSLVVPANSNKEMSLVYLWNVTAQQQQSINQQCFTSSGVTYTTTGTVNMKMWFHNFDGIDLGPWTNTYLCN